MNKVILMGRLVADPEFSMTTGGKAMCRFRIAVDRGYKQGDDKQSDFFYIKCWDSTAELVNRYFVKGKPILLEGRIQNNNYIDKNGVQQYRDDIIADRVSFLLSDPTRTGSGNSGSRRYDDYDNDRYDDDRYRRSSSRRNDRYDDDDDYRSRRRSDRYDDDDRDRRRTSRYDDDDYRRDSRRDEGDDRRRDAQDEESRSASSQPKKDIQLGNDSDDSDLGDFKEIISENDLPF